MGIVNYLTDAYEKYTALALSAAPLGRNTFVAFLPSASYSLLQTPEFGWAGSVLGFVGLASSTGPVVLLFKGSEIHAKSPFMLDSTLDEDEDEYKTSRAVLVAEERWDQRVLQEVRLEALMMLSEITDIRVYFCIRYAISFLKSRQRVVPPRHISIHIPLSRSPPDPLRS
ncbi:hypothetical protein HBI63_213100 [Parastagonospora nodorum]|nr:hypothetical protein HBH97_198930 [Parastagonospora nodorum]KAH6139362.1 hypothetical protein HBI63_213100 [Parastagonospora nodorum]